MPHPKSYEDAYDTFSLGALEAAFQGSFEDGINACIECCDRYADPGRVALRWERQNGERGSLTFVELKERASRFANFLAQQNVKAGDVVAVMLPRTPELLIAAMGIWRAGAVYQPLFTAFGPKAIEHRLMTSEAKLVITDAANRGKLDDVVDAPHALVVRPDRPGDWDFDRTLAVQSAHFEPVLRTGDDLLALMSTSGTTGLPKGVPVPLRALAAFRAYMTLAVDLRPEDHFWNIADPGWAYGLYYAVIGPLLLGSATTFYDGHFTAESTYRIIREHHITNLAGAPTAYRLLIAAGEEAAAKVRGQLRAVSSAGEPLNPEVIRWFAEHLSAPIYDHYGQTETAMMVNNHHGLIQKVRPGSAGLPMPGFRVAVLDEDGKALGPNQPGVLAVDLARSPLCFFRGYYRQETPAI
ncbi:MAG: AMP-binding protein, partial [Proteobacteria bacterium]|nr:AMP-binding protein [Pseudomonadota bacterium]